MFGETTSPQKQTQTHFETEAQAQAQLGRVRYLRKLYFLVFLQLLGAFIVISTSFSSPDFGNWVYNYKGFTLWTSLILFVAIQLGVFFLRKTFSKFPINVLLYVINLVAFAFLLAYLSQALAHGGQKEHLILNIVLGFTFVSGALLVHSILTRYELTFQSATLYILAAVYFRSFIILVFDPSVTIIRVIEFAIVSTIWGFYLVWDNETVVSGVRSDWSKEDYIVGATGVYMNIFVLVLSIADQIRALLIKTRTK